MSGGPVRGEHSLTIGHPTLPLEILIRHCRSCVAYTFHAEDPEIHLKVPLSAGDICCSFSISIWRCSNASDATSKRP